MVDDSDSLTSKTRLELVADKREAFLVELARHGMVAPAARAVGLDRIELYKYRTKHPEFAARWEDALEEALDTGEKALRDRGVDGWLEPVYYLGEVVGHVRKFSDTNLQFWLKGRRPERFRERVEVSGKVDIASEILERRKRAGIRQED